MSFRRGLADALPIFFGYLSVGFAFGILSVTYGHPAWSPVLMSATQLSGTGQFAVINFLHAGSSLGAVLTAVIVFNLRYILMALAVAQRLDVDIGTGKRLLMAMGDTDEIVGVALAKSSASSGKIGFAYFMGLTACSYAGWVTGTLLAVGPWTGDILSERLVAALGIALYAMFCAIILPATRKSRAALLCVGLAAALNVGLRLAKIGLDGGWITLLSGVASAAVAAALFPKEPEGGATDKTGKEAV